jgi:hypothetical protein
MRLPVREPMLRACVNSSAQTLEIAVHWHVTACNVMEKYQYLGGGGTYWLHLEGTKWSQRVPLKHQ